MENELKIPNQYASLEFVRSISWPEIFDQWKASEAHQESWKKHWEERGFSSWDEWRTAYVAPIEPETLSWSLYKINNPLQELPLIFGVPADTWIKKAYAGETTKKLKDILDTPLVKENDKISAVKNNFPKETMLTGLIFGDKIMLVEGMHRACALASWDTKVPLNSEITIALALWKKEIPRVGGNYKK